VVWSGFSDLPVGHGNTRSCSRPTLIQSLVDDNVKVVAIDCGSHHSVAVAEDGSVWTFGCAEYGQLGGLTEYADWSGGNQAGGNQEAFNVPRRMPQFDRMDPPRKVKAVGLAEIS
jgi:alpha-tubulin suppressor-like RCC1 family protein